MSLAIGHCRAVRDCARWRRRRRSASVGLRIGRVGVSSASPLRVLAQTGQGAAAAKARSVSVSSSSVLWRMLSSASSRRNPASSRIRTMAWPPMARPIASMARPVDGGQIEQEAFAGLAQRVDRVIHLQRRLRRQPGSERENALRLMLLRILRHQQRDVAADLRAVVARRPGDQHLRFREQQRAEAVGLELQVADFGAAAPRSWRRARACASTGSRRPRKSRAAPARVVSAAISWRSRSSTGASVSANDQIGGAAGRRISAGGSAKANQAVARQSKCTTAGSDASPRSRLT